MGKGKHKRGVRKGEFCAIPAKNPCDDCPSDKNYREICEPRAPNWSALQYAQKYSIKDKVTKKILEVTAKKRSYEAHHILCVAQVNNVVIRNSEKYGYIDILKKTKWCINQKKNMIALPLWAHTILWYCNSFFDILHDNKDNPINEESLLRAIEPSRLLKPPFRNLPQHNYGHSGGSIEKSYNMEVSAKLKKIVKTLKKDKKKHDNTRIEWLKSKLIKLSKEFENKLRERGNRDRRGTHEAWLLGSTNPKSNWYEPFSMSQVPAPKTFPGAPFNRGMGEKIKNLATALWKWHTKF